MFLRALIRIDITSPTGPVFAVGMHSGSVASALFSFSWELQLAYDPIKIIVKELP